MNRKKTNYLLASGVVLIITVLFIGLVNAISFNAPGATDLVYSMGKQQLQAKLLAQNDGAQKVIEVYNIISGADYMSAASSLLCQEDPKICEQIPKLRMAISAAGSISDPSAFTEQLMKQELCKEEAAMCTAYGESLSAYNQASNPWGTAQNYAMSKAVEQIDSDLARKASQVMQAKSYLDRVIVYDESKAKPKEMADPASDITGDVVKFSDEDFEDEFELLQESQDIASSGQIIDSIKDEYAETCLVAFNFDGTYGPIKNCITKVPIVRTDWSGHDLSSIIAQPANTLMVGSDCSLKRDITGIAISSKDMKGKQTACFVNLQGNMFKDLIGGTVAKGPDGKRMTSASFIIDGSAKLVYAEFQVAKDSDYIFDEKKYSLKQGTTVIYKEGEDLKIGFDEVEEPTIMLSSFTKGQWVESALITPRDMERVKVELLDDGRYKISGRFTLEGDMDDLQVGSYSDAVIHGINLRTTEKDARFTLCKDLGEGNWVDYCDRDDKLSYSAKGKGFAFNEAKDKNRHYYLDGCEGLDINLRKKANGKYERDEPKPKGKCSWGFTGYGGYFQEVDGVLKEIREGAIYSFMTDFDETRDSEVEGETLAFASAGLTGQSLSSDSICLTPENPKKDSKEDSKDQVTGAAITGAETFKAPIQCKGAGNLKYNSPDAPMQVALADTDLEIDDCCTFSSCVCFNDEELKSSNTDYDDDNEIWVAIGEEEPYTEYYIHPCTGVVYTVSGSPSTSRVATLNTDQMKDVMEIVEDKFKASVDLMPKRSGYIYAAPWGDHTFIRGFRSGWRCKGCGDGNIYRICTEMDPPSCRALFVPVQKECPRGTSSRRAKHIY